MGTSSAKPSGDAQFDYLLGIAAVDSGRVAEGVKLLQTFVAANPADARARLELARGLFLLGDNEAAKREFLTAKDAKPPQGVVDNIDIYLKAIEDRVASGATASASGVTSYVEAGIGHDSNINGGVSGANITLPVAGAVTIDPNGVQQNAAFARLAGGVQGNWPLRDNIAAFAATNLDSRFHSHSESFNNLYGTAQGGLGLNWQRQVVRASVNWNTLVLNRSTFRTSPSLLGEWQGGITESLSAFASSQYGFLKYAGANFIRDASFKNITVGLRQAFDAAWKPALVFSYNVGRERNRREREDLARNSDGTRLAVELTPLSNLQLTAGYSVQSSRYIADDLFFGISRRDAFKSMDFAAVYTLSRQWSLRADLAFSETKSNIELNSSRRASGAVNVRYSF